MQHPNYLKEKTIHGTALMPVAIHHLSYAETEHNYFGLHWHEEVELLHVLSGSLIYTVEDQDIIVCEGEGLFINTNLLHGAKSHENNPCEAVVVVFHPSLFASSSHGDTYGRYVYPILSGDRQTSFFLSHEINWQELLLDQMTTLGQLRHQPLEEWSMLLISYLYHFWHNLYQHSHPTGNSNQVTSYKSNRLKPVLAHMHEHYPEPLDLESLADMIPLSKGQFCRTFKDTLGTTPIAYLIRYRLTKACEMLADSDKKIGVIARSVGFDNISYFNREFMKAMGTSPKNYRISQLKSSEI